jgi:hypothetical protein
MLAAGQATGRDSGVIISALSHRSRQLHLVSPPRLGHVLGQQAERKQPAQPHVVRSGTDQAPALPWPCSDCGWTLRWPMGLLQRKWAGSGAVKAATIYLHKYLPTYLLLCCQALRHAIMVRLTNVPPWLGTVSPIIKTLP